MVGTKLLPARLAVHYLWERVLFFGIAGTYFFKFFA